MCDRLQSIKLSFFPKPFSHCPPPKWKRTHMPKTEIDAKRLCERSRMTFGYNLPMRCCWSSWRCCWLSSSDSILCTSFFNPLTLFFNCLMSFLWPSTLWVDAISSSDSSNNHTVLMVIYGFTIGYATRKKRSGNTQWNNNVPFYFT